MLRMQLSSGTSGYHANLLKSSTPCGASSRRSLSSHRHQERPIDGTQVLSKWPLSLGQWCLLFSLALFLGLACILSSLSIPGLGDKTRSLALGALSHGLSLHMKSALLGELEASLSDDRSRLLGGTGVFPDLLEGLWALTINLVSGRTGPEIPTAGGGSCDSRLGDWGKVRVQAGVTWLGNKRDRPPLESSGMLVCRIVAVGVAVDRGRE